MSNQDQADIFSKIWPKKILLTPETLSSAVSAGLELEWLAEWMLSKRAYADYLARRDALLIAALLAAGG